MKHLFRFFLLLGLGLAVLWAAVGKDAIFPSKKKQEGGTPLEKPHIPAIRVNQGSGAISMAPRGKLNIRSSRARKLPDGRIVQFLRYSLRSANAQPNPDGTYTLHKAVLTFYRGGLKPVPAAHIQARKMILSMVTGREGIRPMEDQEMALEQVKVKTGDAFQEAALLLETEKLLVRTSSKETTFRTPSADTPFTLSGALAGGGLDMKGLGLEGTLPPPEQGGKPGTGSKEGNPFFRFLGRSRNEGTWKRKGAGGTVRFSCAGPFLMERKTGTADLEVSLEEEVRLERSGEAKAVLLASSLEAVILPGRGMKEGKAEARIRRVVALGNPVNLVSPEGDFLAGRMEALFREDGTFLAMKALGNPSASEKRPNGTSFSARCEGPLTLVSLEGNLLPWGPIRLLPGAAAGLPSSLVTLSGRAVVSLTGGKGAGSLQASRGLEILLSRRKEILGLAGFGFTKFEAPGLKGSSDLGITMSRAPFFESTGRARTAFQPPGRSRPANFSVTASGKGGKGDFFLEGRGFLSRESFREGKTVVSARAAGPGGLLKARASTPRGKVLLEEARGLSVIRSGKGEAAILAWRDFPGPLRASFPSRGITAWAARLEGKGKETRLYGREGEPVLLTAPVEDKEGNTSRMRLLAGEALLQEGKTLLHARRGVRLRFQGKSILPGAEGGNTTLASREMFLFTEKKGGKPASALLSGNVVIRILRASGTTLGSGKDLWISLGEKRAILSGSPARIQAESGGGRSVTVISEIIRLSREETVAGDLAAGIGGKIVIASDRTVFGGAAEKGSRIEAVCGMPIHMKGDFLVFPGASILEWVQGADVPAGEKPTLICGSMVAKRGPGGGEPFLWIKGKNGVKFKKGAFQGTGESLFFQPGPGILRIDGGTDSCRLGMGDQAFQGRRITLNIHDFTWKVEGSSSRRVPLPASVEKNQGGYR